MESVVFTCSICGDESREICVYCTKDSCGNHLCERCYRCSDCCHCDMPLTKLIKDSGGLRPPFGKAHASEPEPSPLAEFLPILSEF